MVVRVLLINPKENRMKFIDKIEKEINDEFGKLGDEDEGLLKDFDDDTDFSEVPEVKKLIKHLDK